MATKTRPQASGIVLTCTNCEAELGPRARFCPECGRAVKLPGSRATFGPRYAALLVDLSVVFALWFVASIAFRPFIRLLPDPPADRVALGNFTPAFEALAGVILIPLVALLYFWISHAIKGRTLGKKIVGLRVVRLGTQYQPGWMRSLIRDAIVWGPLLLFLGGAAGTTIWGGGLSTLIGRIGAPLLLITLLGNLGAVIFWKEHRGLHDLGAGTETIRD